MLLPIRNLLAWLHALHPNPVLNEQILRTFFDLDQKQITPVHQVGEQDEASDAAAANRPRRPRQVALQVAEVAERAMRFDKHSCLTTKYKHVQ